MIDRRLEIDSILSRYGISRRSYHAILNNDVLPAYVYEIDNTESLIAEMLSIYRKMKAPLDMRGFGLRAKREWDKAAGIKTPRVIVMDNPEHEHEEIDALTALLQAGRTGWLTIDGKDCRIYLEPRPAYCDRGNWYAKVDYLPGGDRVALYLDGADGWPRYFFDAGCAASELKAWLVKRKQWVGAEWVKHDMSELDES